MKSFVFVVLCALVAVCAGDAVRQKRGWGSGWNGGLYSGISGWNGGYAGGWGGYSGGWGGYGRGWGGYAPIVKPVYYGGYPGGYGGVYSSGWW